MATDPEPDASEHGLHERAADALSRDGLVVLDGWLGAARAHALRAEVLALVGGPYFRAAGVGARTDHVIAPAVRGDSVCWFITDDSDAGDRDDDPEEHAGLQPGSAVQQYVARLERLVSHLNETCFLGLRRIECHAACFEPGAFYQAHTDAFRGDTRRVISVCYYLNDLWTEAAGGCLRIHADPLLDVAPLLDRMVLFRSADVLHQVMPTTVRRLSLTGWLSRHT